MPITPSRPAYSGALLAIAALLLPGAAAAHSFGVIYTLPVPFWLYAWASAAALIVSFVIVGVFATQPATRQADGVAAGRIRQLPAWLLAALKLGSLAALLLCIVCGLLGTPNPYGNFNMTFFWIVFVLGFAYLTAVVGDLYSRISPFRTLTQLLPQQGWLRYPAALGYTPALLFYAGFLWLELFSRGAPHTLAWALLLYTGWTLLGAALFGTRDWLRHGEFFGVWLRLIARMAPIAFEDDHTGRFRWRWPLAGLRAQAQAHWTLLLFVLFMLSSTAFDGLHEAQVWVEFYWVTLYRALFSDWFGSNPIAAFPQMRALYQHWQLGWLLLSPWLYFVFYLAGIGAMRLLLRGRHSLMSLALAFMPSLLPIVLVYHVTHYYTLIETQGIRVIALASDPLGRGWDLFGTATWFRRVFVPDTGVVWHVQVGLILLGHIASVYVAHLIALDLLRQRRAATLSQLPMLVLMVAFTVAGLWILSQPIKVSP